MASVLLVDDDRSLLGLLTMVLQQGGHEVHGASNGVEALMLYSSNRPKIDIVVSDILMPGMNGVELSARLRALNPKVRILLMTGFVPDEITVPDDLQVLQKPFEPASLIDAIEQRLSVPLAKQPH